MTSIHRIKILFSILPIFALTQLACAAEWRKVETQGYQSEREVDVESVVAEGKAIRYSLRYGTGVQRQILAKCAEGLRAELITKDDINSPKFSPVYATTNHGNEVEVACAKLKQLTSLSKLTREVPVLNLHSISTRQPTPSWLTIGRDVGGGEIVRIDGPTSANSMEFTKSDPTDPLWIQWLPGNRIAYLSGKGEITNLRTNDTVVLPLTSASPVEDSTTTPRSPLQAQAGTDQLPSYTGKISRLSAAMANYNFIQNTQTELQEEQKVIVFRMAEHSEIAFVYSMVKAAALGLIFPATGKKELKTTGKMSFWQAEWGIIMLAETDSPPAIGKDVEVTCTIPFQRPRVCQVQEMRLRY